MLKCQIQVWIPLRQECDLGEDKTSFLERFKSIDFGNKLYDKSLLRKKLEKPIVELNKLEEDYLSDSCLDTSNYEELKFEQNDEMLYINPKFE